jgi:hypothetical protein
LGSIPPVGSKLCAECSASLSGLNQKKFCSLSCSVTYNNRAKSDRKKEADRWRAIPFKFCVYCNRSFPTPGERARNKFCSRSCAVSENNRLNPKRKRKLHATCLLCLNICHSASGLCKPCRKEQLISDWLSGKTTYATVNTFIRKWLHDQCGPQCWTCGWNKCHPVDGRPLVQVEHRDGNSENNSPENLELLCPNCHSQTPTYGSRNSGNGRSRRREIYNRT